MFVSDLTSYLNPISRVAPSLDVDIIPWAGLLNDVSTNDHLLGLFGSLPPEPIPVPSTETDSLPPFGSADFSYNQLFNFDCGTSYPCPEPQVDSLFPADLIEGANMNDLLSFTLPASDNTRVKFVQLEQLKKHQSRLQEYIVSLYVSPVLSPKPVTDT